MTQRVLIYRLGSIGDTLVALPAFRTIARAFPDAQRKLLCERTWQGQAVASTLLDGTGLINGTITYSLGERGIGSLLKLRREIREFNPDTLIYLVEPRWDFGAFKVWRDLLFFRLCGIKNIIGAPLSHDLRTPRHNRETNLWEREGERLVRCLAPLDGAKEGQMPHQDWALPLMDEEIDIGDAILAELMAKMGDHKDFIAACVGAKFDYRDWGEENWLVAFKTMAQETPDLGLVLVGGPGDMERSERVAALWKGPTLNLCGKSLRLSAAVLRRAKLFLTGNGGMMHLAASQNVPCIAVFGAWDLPGHWFPYGDHHRTLFRYDPCKGCEMRGCMKMDPNCQRLIKPDEVVQAFLNQIAGDENP